MLGLRKFLGQRYPDIWRIIPSKVENPTNTISLEDDKEIFDEAINLINLIKPKPRFVAFIGNRYFTKTKSGK